MDAFLAAAMSRRRFLRQSFAWSAMAAMPALASAAAKDSGFAAQGIDPHAAHALVIGDWGYVDKPSHDDPNPANTHQAQSQVARGMRRYAQATGLKPEALLMLGDSWYGDLPGGVESPRWVEGFEQMYPADVFPGPAYTMLGNHDYQAMPPEVNKVEAELGYAKQGRARTVSPRAGRCPRATTALTFPRVCLLRLLPL